MALEICLMPGMVLTVRKICDCSISLEPAGAYVCHEVSNPVCKPSYAPCGVG